MSTISVLFDCFRGKHRFGQILNYGKFLLGKKEPVVSWDPIMISLFLTYRCNLNCDMCLTHSTKFENPFGQKPCNDMDFGLFKQVLERYKNAFSVTLLGNGEPLLHKDLFKMIEYASNVMKMDVFSGSNGILVGDYIDEITNSPLKKFTISLNGHNSLEFYRMTGMDPKLFSKISTNIAELVKQKKIKSSGMKIRVSFILDTQNYQYLKDMIYFANNLGVDEIVFFQFLPSHETGFMAEERCLFIDNLDVLESFRIVGDLPSAIRRKVILPALLSRQMSNNRFCSVWFSNICVDGDGNVGGCSCQLLDLSPSGKYSDKNVWNGEYFQMMRKRFIDPEIPIMEPCMQCYNNTVQAPKLISIMNTSHFKKFNR